MPILTKKQLASREQVGKGCLERYDKVVINSSEPADCCDFHLAKAVADNIKERVFYEFHFGFQEEDIDNLCSQWIDHIRILMATYCIGEDQETTEGDLKKEDDILDFLNRNKDKALEAIEAFHKRLKIFIHKSPHPIPFRIAAHNVSSPDKAICYLRHNSSYVEWFFKDDARQALATIKGNSHDAGNGAIFQGSDDLRLYTKNPNEINELKELEEKITKALIKANLELCYKNDNKTAVEIKKGNNRAYLHIKDQSGKQIGEMNIDMDKTKEELNKQPIKIGNTQSSKNTLSLDQESLAIIEVRNNNQDTQNKATYAFAKEWNNVEIQESLTIGNRIRKKLDEKIDELFNGKEIDILRKEVKKLCTGGEPGSSLPSDDENLEQLMIDMVDSEDEQFRYEDEKWCICFDDKADDIKNKLKNIIYRDFKRVPIFDTHKEHHIKHIIDKGRLREALLGKPHSAEETLGGLLKTEKWLCDYTWACMSGNDTVADAKKVMSTVSNCCDVIITDNGSHTGTVKGWIPIERLSDNKQLCCEPCEDSE